MSAPSHATFGNFIRNELATTIEQIFHDINVYIFEVDHVDLEHTYIDGTKIEANVIFYNWFGIKDKKYRNNSYRAINFKRNDNGDLICPNGKKLIFKNNKPVYKNKYGRTEENYECENCVCMNPSIQAEGTFWIIKWNRSYKRLFRRRIEGVSHVLNFIGYV